MRQYLFIVGLAVAWFVLPIVAEGEKAKDAAGAEKPKKEAPVLIDLNLTGVVEKVEKAGKDGQNVVSYGLKDAAGTVIALPQAKAKKDAPAAYDLAALVGAQVKVVAKGTEKVAGDKKKVTIKEIVSIEKVAAEVPPAPAQ